MIHKLISSVDTAFEKALVAHLNSTDRQGYFPESHCEMFYILSNRILFLNSIGKKG